VDTFLSQDYPVATGMSESINAFEAIGRIPGWDADAAEIEELKGGLTNRTYYVSHAGTECVLRLDSAQSRLFQFDRSRELAILTAAARAGVAPAVIHAEPRAGILVTEYLPGRVWTDEDLQDNRQLEALAKLLRKVHALPASGLPLDMPQVAATYERHLEKRQGLHAFASHCVDIIGSIPVGQETACCHNDVVAANVIDGDALKLIDWEFACDYDPMFDLASAIGFHNLDEARAGILLNAYMGRNDTAAQERLAVQVRIYDAIQWLWLANRHLIFPSRWQARRLEELQQRIR